MKPSAALRAIAITAICLLPALLVSFAWTAPCLAQCSDDLVEIKSEDSATGVLFYLTSRRTIEASVNLKCDFLQNATASHPLPLNFVVDRPYSKYEILRFTQTTKNQPWHWGNYQYHFAMGAPSRLQTTDHIYTLPYPQSKHCIIGQSYFGIFSHQKGTPDEYAVDIVMPEGTPVLAARGGTVIGYKDDSNMGGASEQFKLCCNYVTIKHDDGTYGAYIHLKQRGVTVQLGQVVAAGSQIGYSGATGWVTQPHLHFMVYRVKTPATIYTIPFKMRTPSGVVPQLEEGETY